MNRVARILATKAREKEMKIILVVDPLSNLHRKILHSPVRSIEGIEYNGVIFNLNRKAGGFQTFWDWDYRNFGRDISVIRSLALECKEITLDERIAPKHGSREGHYRAGEVTATVWYLPDFFHLVVRGKDIDDILRTRSAILSYVLEPSEESPIT